MLSGISPEDDFCVQRASVGESVSNTSINPEVEDLAGFKSYVLKEGKEVKIVLVAYVGCNYVQSNII
jgi:hypothetical protein